MKSSLLRFTPELTAYLRQEGNREHPVLTALREETASLPMAQMQISLEQGALMSMLVSLMGARRTLEIGTFTGYSALAVALALPPDGEMVCCDVSQEWTDVAKRAWARAGVDERITLCLRPALETLDELVASGQAGSFDFAFIDADKANYDRYYEYCLQLLRRGGLVAIDNVLWNGAVIDDKRQDDDTRCIRALNAKVRADRRVESCMLPVSDGLTLARVL